MVEKIGIPVMVAILGVFIFIPSGSSQRTNLFGPGDIIERNGFEWVQPDLFNLTWDEVVAACPERMCSGELNGYDMSGWKVATTYELSSLFYTYMQPYGLDEIYLPPSPEYPSWLYNSQGLCWNWAGDFIADGWRPTENLYNGETLVAQRILGSYWSAYAPDICGAGNFIHYVDPNGFCADGAGIVGPVSCGPEEYAGVWFNRPICNGCGCPAD